MAGTAEWYTPAPIIEAARAVLGGIDLDPASCAEANRTVQATKYFDQKANGLERSWYGRIWLNPPYSRGLIGAFVDKLAEDRADYHQAIVLVNASPGVEWFTKLSAFGDVLCLLDKRLRFRSPDHEGAQSPRHGQAVFGIGCDLEAFLHAFRELGCCWKK